MTKVDLVVLLIAVTGLGIAYGINLIAALQYPLAIEYEGTMFWAADALSRGHNIYDAARLISPPWAVITYPPIFLALSSMLFKLCGPAFWCLRAVSAIATLASVLLFFRILRISGCNLIAAMIGTTFFFAYSPVFVWAVVGRPDMLSVALALAGMERAFSAELECRAGRSFVTPSIVSGLLFALACFTKQPALVCFATSILFMVWNKRWRPAAYILGTGCLFLGILLGSIQLLTGGLWQNLSIFGTTPWDTEMLVRYMHFMSDTDTYLVEISFAVVLYCLILRKQNITETERMPYLLFALSLAQMIYIMGLPGSNGNHAMFPLMALSWWLALKSNTLPLKATRVILLLSLIGAPFLATYFPVHLAVLPSVQETKTALEALHKDLQGTKVLAEDPYDNIVTDTKPQMIDCAVFMSIWEKRPEQRKPLIEAMQKHEFSAVIINEQDSDGGGRYTWMPDVLAALRSNYHQIGKISANGIVQKIWRSNDAAPEKQAPMTDKQADPVSREKH